MQLPIQFFLQNFHFALDLFFALVTFAIFWLYFDAWTVAKKFRDLSKSLGFLLVALSFVVQATIVEEAFFGQGLLGNYAEMLAVFLRLIGYLGIIYSLLTDPLPQKPVNTGLKLDKKSPALFPGILINLKFLLPLGALSIALLYYRRATRGLENHLKQIALGFFFLALSESFFLATLLRISQNIDLSNATAAFGPVWWLEQICLLISALILGRWIWSYLTERLQSQLFMIFTSSVLVIFLIVSVTFSYLLVNNIENAALGNLETATKLLSYSLDSKKAEIASKAEVFSQNPEIVAAVIAKDHAKLNTLLQDSLTQRKTSSIMIINNGGMVLARAEDPEKWGDSVSSDPLVKQALSEKEESNYSVKEGVLAPTISLQAAKPILKDGKVVGAALVSLELSNNFLDGVKSSTGLESALYSGNQRSSTTIVSQGGKERVIGVKESNKAINETVLRKGKMFTGTLTILNKPYLVVFSPIKNINNQIIGMSLAAQSQNAILKVAGNSIEAIFILSTILLLLSIVPAFFIARYISRQLH
ncbi:MAG TPA: cache domain-containing protein [Candidatus Saccharimonadales bacterium]|nr:cache domain-containing protein [Candidatus Saccharimonadales bacterium]